MQQLSVCTESEAGSYRCGILVHQRLHNSGGRVGWTLLCKGQFLETRWCHVKLQMFVICPVLAFSPRLFLAVCIINKYLIVPTALLYLPRKRIWWWRNWRNITSHPLECSQVCGIITWTVDDIFVIFPSQVVNTIHETIGKTFCSIKFIHEEEENGSLSFQDIIVRRDPKGGLNITFYRKTTDTDHYLDFDSCHPMDHKQAVLIYTPS